MSTKPLLDVTCAIIRTNSRYLLVQRPPHKQDGLKWEFPGGKVELGETAAACIQREILEELQMQIELRGALRPSTQVGESRSICLRAFLAVPRGSEPRLLEHVALKWCTLREISELDLCVADRPFLEILAFEELESSGWWRDGTSLS